MATIMASRAKFNDELNDPVELYTYGSPRVGWKKYVKSLEVKHHRWRNNNDIVPSVPPSSGLSMEGTSTSKCVMPSLLT